MTLTKKAFLGFSLIPVTIVSFLIYRQLRLPYPRVLSVTQSSSKPPQFIVLSFDGSKSLEMWQKTRTFAQKLNQEGKPLHFTYFISGVYFLAPGSTRLYHPPQLAAGTSLIGFSDSKEDIVKRVSQINGALTEGHEIASHANGHFRGFPWSKKDWNQEFDEFNKLVFDWQKNNQISTEVNLNLNPQDIVGFRAPLLSRNDNLYKILGERHFLYDSSGLASSPSAWPTKNTEGTWLIPLANIPLAGTKGEIIAMDYNFYSRQSEARDLAKKDTPTWQRLYKQTLDSYLGYFVKNYKGNRAPVIIGHHFSLWNDGVYWQVMQDFAEKVCGQPEVYCTSFKELAAYLEKK